MLSAALPTDPEIAARVDRIELPFNQFGIDPYGVDKAELAKLFTMLAYFARKYFRVEAYGLDHIPDSGRAMLVGNHSGGIAIDGAMVIATCFLELEPPRLAQGMVDKFLARLPDAGQMAARVGQFTGLPEHAERLLRDERLLMVFPEGHRGTAKLAKDSDSLVRFGTGFVRLALKTKTPIVPLAFVGGGDAFPTVMNLQIGKMFGVPYIPITRYLLPVPRRTTFQLLYGSPIRLEGDGSEDDATIAGMVESVRDRIKLLIEQGRALREGHIQPHELELG